jgi:MFS family permease
MAIISLVPVLPLLLQEFAHVPGSDFLVPVALTIPALCIALFSPFAGWISDRVGRKLLLVATLCIYATVGVVPYFLTELAHIIVARVALGITEAAIMTLATALIGDYFEGERRERWLAIQVAVVSLSAIILIALGGFLGETFGARGPFLLYLIALPIALAAALVLFEPEVTSRTEVKAEPLPLLRILPLLFITLFVGILFYTMIVKLGPILELNGPLSPAIIGMAGALANVGVALGTLLFQGLRKRRGPLLLTIGFALFALGYSGVGLASNLIVSTAFAVVTCLGAGLLLPTMITWVLQNLPASVRGRGTGLWTGMFYLGQFIAPIVATGIEAPVGGLTNVLLVYSACAAVGALLAIFMIRKGRPLDKSVIEEIRQGDR